MPLIYIHPTYPRLLMKELHPNPKYHSNPSFESNLKPDL